MLSTVGSLNPLSYFKDVQAPQFPSLRTVLKVAGMFALILSGSSAHNSCEVALPPCRIDSLSNKNPSFLWQKLSWNECKQLLTDLEQGGRNMTDTPFLINCAQLANVEPEKATCYFDKELFMHALFLWGRKTIQKYPNSILELRINLTTPVSHIPIDLSNVQMEDLLQNPLLVRKTELNVTIINPKRYFNNTEIPTSTFEHTFGKIEEIIDDSSFKLEIQATAKNSSASNQILHEETFTMMA